MTMRYSKNPSHRQLKVAEEIRKRVSQLMLNGDIYHPYLEGIILSINDARISSDLGMATIFFTHSGGEKKNVLEVLNSLVPEIRMILAKKIQLRMVPQLRFVYDETIDNSVRIGNLLNNPD